MSLLKQSLLALILALPLAVMADSPCTRCHTIARDSYAVCMATAKTEAQKSNCTTRLQADVQRCMNTSCAASTSVQ